jgi:hypothetical protein
MSKKINVNPGQYKVAGRERQGEDIVHDVQRQAYAQQQAQAELWQPERRETPESPAPPPARERIWQAPPGRRPAKKASRARGPTAKAKGTRTKAPRAPKPAAKKRKAPARKTRTKATRKKS